MVKNYNMFLNEGKAENDKIDQLLDNLSSLSTEDKELLTYLTKGGLLKDYKPPRKSEPKSDMRKSGTRLTRNQQEVVDMFMEDYGIDLTNGWFIFCLEEDPELQEDRYEHTIYFFPAEDPWFDQQPEVEEFFPYELDPEPHMLAESRYGYDGNFKYLKDVLEKTGFFKYVNMDDREEFHKNHNNRND